MKNILLIIPNMDFGGAQRSFSKLSIALAEKYNVVNVVFNKEDGLAYPLGGETISLDIKASASFINKLVNFYIRIIKIKAIKKSKNIDVAISFLEGADFINLLSKRNEKIIVSIRGSKHSDETIRGFVGWLRKRILIPFLYKKADNIMTVNRGIVDELNRFYGLSNIKKTVISNYYDVASIQAMAKEELPEAFKDITDKPYLVFSGRLAPEKGIDKLIEVYAGLKERLNYRFIVVGSGPMKNTLIAKGTQLGLSLSDDYKADADIIFVGAQNNPHCFVARAQLFLMASSSEGFPNGLAEAMACSVPVVSTDCPWGPREILSEKQTSELPEYADYGILLPMLNKQGAAFFKSMEIWRTVLDKLLADATLRRHYSEQGLAKVKQFNEQVYFGHWDQLINE